MTNDILAVLWKEWRELMRQRSTRGGLMNWGIMVLLIGIFIPIQTGVAWVRNPVLLLLWAWPSVLAVMWIVADSFAGERERHTLETLLASRLPDRSILFGKIIACVLYGWSIEVAGLLVGLVTVNILHADEQGLLLYPMGWFAGILVFSLIVIFLISTIGCLVSMHSSSVRAAYQKMSLAIFALFMVPSIIFSILPQETTSRLFSGFSLNPSVGLLVAIGAVLVLLDAVFLWFSLQRFQRSRLILD